MKIAKRAFLYVVSVLAGLSACYALLGSASLGTDAEQERSFALLIVIAFVYGSVLALGNYSDSMKTMSICMLVAAFVTPILLA